MRPDAEELDATQFEVLAAAAFAEFAAREVDVAVVEAGLGGRLDATNVLDAPVVVLTNVALEHTEHLGTTREEIAAEKLAVVRPGATLVLGEPEWGEGLHGESNEELAVLAASALLGRPVDPAAAREVAVPGRLEQVGDAPLELWDGAHNVAGVDYVLARLPEVDEWTMVVSILSDKDADSMLAALATLGRRAVVTSSGHARAIPAEELSPASPPGTSPRSRPWPTRPRRVARARTLAGPAGAVLVTGSLTLIARLAAVRPAYVRWVT